MRQECSQQNRRSTPCRRSRPALPSSLHASALWVPAGLQSRPHGLRPHRQANKPARLHKDARDAMASKIDCAAW
eukprot:776281-Alexandrium_andersonii.AAC.1